MKSARRELEDVVFAEADAKWVHHPHSDALVIAARVANSNVHRMLIDDGSVMDIIHLDAYKRMWLTKNELSPSTSPLFGFIGNHVISKGTIKLVVMMGEHLQESTVMTEFLIVDCPSTLNRIIGRLLLKAVTSIYNFTMKFLTAEGTGQV